MSSPQARTIIGTFDEAMRLVTMALKLERRLPHDVLSCFFNIYPKVLKSATANSNVALIPSIPNQSEANNKSIECYKLMLQKSIQLLCLCMMEFPAEMTELIQQVSMMGMVTLQPPTGFPLREVRGEDSGTAKAPTIHRKNISLIDGFKEAMRYVLSAFAKERRMSHHLLYAFYDIYPKIVMHKNAEQVILMTHHPDSEFLDSRWSYDIIELQRSLHILCECVTVCPEVIASLIPLVSHAMISFDIPGFPL